MKLPAVPPGQIVHAQVFLSPGNILDPVEYADLEISFIRALNEAELRRLHPDQPQYAGQPLIPCPQYPMGEE